MNVPIDRLNVNNMPRGQMARHVKDYYQTVLNKNIYSEGWI